MVRPGYTLIELLATIAIVIILAVTGIPIFSNYQTKIGYTQKVEETEAIINQYFTLVKNPAREAASYLLVINKNQNELKLKLCEKADCKDPIDVTKVSFGKDIYIENRVTFENREVENNILMCEIPGDECFILNQKDRQKIDGSKLFFQIRNTKLIDSTKEFIVRQDPLGILVK